MNQRDDLGDADTGRLVVDRAARPGMGFPDCYGQSGGSCAGKPAPVAALDAHAAVSGVAIVTGRARHRYRHGRTGGGMADREGRSGRTGRRRLVDERNDAATYLTGLKNPFGLVLGPDHGLYAGDWATGTIYRISQ